MSSTILGTIWPLTWLWPWLWAQEPNSCARHTFSLCSIFLWSFIKFASVLFELLLRQDFDLWPDCDLDLGRRNLNHVHDTPPHYALSFCEVSSNLLLYFMRYRWDTICYGRTDGRTDGTILICHLKFLRGHKKLLFLGGVVRGGG